MFYYFENVDKERKILEKLHKMISNEHETYFWLFVRQFLFKRLNWQLKASVICKFMRQWSTEYFNLTGLNPNILSGTMKYVITRLTTVFRLIFFIEIQQLNHNTNYFNFKNSKYFDNLRIESFLKSSATSNDI